jgi:type II secretory pathway pseudopilin PulG
MKVKNYVMVVVIVLLAVALIGVTQYALQDKGVRATKERIRMFRIVAEEQRLMKSILQDKVEIARLQKMFAPADPNKS